MLSVLVAHPVPRSAIVAGKGVGGNYAGWQGKDDFMIWRRGWNSSDIGLSALVVFTVFLVSCNDKLSASAMLPIGLTQSFPPS